MEPGEDPKHSNLRVDRLERELTRVGTPLISSGLSAEYDRQQLYLERRRALSQTEI